MFTFLLFTILQKSKNEKLIKITLNGTIYMNELEIKSRNVMIVYVTMFNYILTVISIS